MKLHLPLFFLALTSYGVHAADPQVILPPPAQVNKTIEAGKVGYNWLIRPQLLWLVDKAEYKERKLIKNCLVGRGHSILND